MEKIILSFIAHLGYFFMILGLWVEESLSTADSLGWTGVLLVGYAGIIWLYYLWKEENG